MINLVTPYIETKMTFDPNRPLLLIVENPREYFNVVVNLNKTFHDEESCFSFWKGDDQISASKIGEFLINCFDFDFSDKRILNLLYKKLSQNYLDGTFIIDFNQLNSKAGFFLQQLFQTVSFSLDYDELTLDGLLKSCSVKPTKTYNSFLEKLICYINIFIELKNIKLFAFVGLKEVLDNEELKFLYKHCELQEVCLLIIESAKHRELLPSERAIIITDDLCEIVENF